MPRSRKNNKKVVPKCDTHHTHTHIHRRPTTASVVGRSCAVAIDVLMIGAILVIVVLTGLAYLFLPLLLLGAGFGLMCIDEGIRTRRLKAEVESFSKDPEKVAAFWKGLPRG